MNESSFQWPELSKSVGPPAVVATLAEFGPPSPYKWLPVLLLAIGVLLGTALARARSDAVLSAKAESVTESATAESTTAESTTAESTKVESKKEAQWSRLQIPIVLLAIAVIGYAVSLNLWVMPLWAPDSNRACVETRKPGYIGFWPSQYLTNTQKDHPEQDLASAIDTTEGSRQQPPWAYGSRGLAIVIIWLSFFAIPVLSAYIFSLLPSSPSKSDEERTVAL